MCLHVSRLVGSDAHTIALQARTVPPNSDSDLSQSSSYAGWHRDYERPATDLALHGPFDHPTLSTSVKLFIAVSDTDETMGPTSLVPGSHCLVDTPPHFNSIADMPGAHLFTGRAGDAMLMDIRCWHAAQPNRSDRPRESVIVQYAAFKWQQAGAFVNSMARLDAASKIPPERPILRQMAGLEIASCLADPRPYDSPASITPWPRTFWSQNDDTLSPEVVEFRSKGCVMLPGLLVGADLQRLQVDFRREQKPARTAWEARTGGDDKTKEQLRAGAAAERYFDLPGGTVFETSPAYAALMSSERLVSLVKSVVGEDVKCTSIQARTVPGNDGNHSCAYASNQHHSLIAILKRACWCFQTHTGTATSAAAVRGRSGTFRTITRRSLRTSSSSSTSSIQHPSKAAPLSFHEHTGCWASPGRSRGERTRACSSLGVLTQAWASTRCREPCAWRVRREMRCWLTSGRGTLRWRTRQIHHGRA